MLTNHQQGLVSFTWYIPKLLFSIMNFEIIFSKSLLNPPGFNEVYWDSWWPIQIAQPQPNFTLLYLQLEPNLLTENAHEGERMLYSFINNKSIISFLVDGWQLTVLLCYWFLSYYAIDISHILNIHIGSLHVNRNFLWSCRRTMFNILRTRRSRRYFADDSFRYIFLNENVWISIEISLKFIAKGPIKNIPVLVQIMAWRRPGVKQLSEPMIVR